MKTAPIPKNESERIESLKKLDILDTPPEERFDRITKLATKIFNVPISTITLVDSNREWFKSVCGLDQKEGERAISFCGHALLEDEILIIPDAKKDPRFADNPMVIGEPYIRFYVGAPIFSAEGLRIGVFCIKDHEPRNFTQEEKEIIQGLTKWAEVEINTHNLSQALDKVKKSVEEIDTFFEIAQDIMVITDTTGRFEKVNPATLDVLGYSLQEITSKPCTFFVHPEDVDNTVSELKKIAKGNVVVNFINRFVTKDGRHLWFQWNATPHNNKFYAVARNITDMKEKEIELERLNRTMIDRELKMVELKEKIKSLESKDEEK